MVKLATLNLSQARRFAQSAEPQINWNTLNDTLMELRDYRPPQTGLTSLIENGLLERGFSPLLPAVQQSQSKLTKGQKQVKRLQRRLRESGQKVPKSEDEGRHGLVGKLFNALGAPSGAVTTVAEDLVNGGQFRPFHSLAQGFTGKNRKTGSDILQDLGVKNKIAKGVGGFALDVALDPTSYIGVGAVKSVASKATRDAARAGLERAGKKVSEKELDNAINEAVGVHNRGETFTTNPNTAIVARSLGRPVEELDDGARFRLLDAQPDLPTQHNLTLGLPFTNKSVNIANLNPLTNTVGRALNALPESSNPILRSVGLVGRSVSRTSNNLFRKFPLPSNIANLFKQRDYRISASYRESLLTAEKTDRDLGGGFNKNPVVHETLANMLDNPERGSQMYAQLSDAQKKQVDTAYEPTRQAFRKIADDEQKLGILDNDKVRSFYFAHLVTGDPRAVQAARDKLASTNIGRVSQSSRFQNERSLQTLDDVQKFVDDFNSTYTGAGKLAVNLDVGQVLATRQLASEVLKQDRALVDRLKHIGKDYVKPARESPRGDANFIQTDTKGLEGYAVRTDVANFLRDWDEISTPGQINGLVRIMDGFNRAWKASVTATPTHYINNAIGGIWNNWMMGVRNPSDYTRSFAMLSGGRGRSAVPNEDILGSIKVTTPQGEMDGNQVLTAAKQFNVIRAGSETDAITRSINKAGTSTLRKIASAPQNLDEAMDDTMRLAGFIDQLEKTGDPWVAAQNVKKYQFDYSELSKTEKKVFSKVIPFYSWTRKNIPLQIMGLVRKPGMFTGAEHAMQEGADATGIDVDQLPGYVANGISIPLFRRDNGNVVMTSPYALPANDLFEFLGAVDSPTEFGKYILNQVAPWYKAVPEVAANEDFFTGAPIDREAENTDTDPSAQSVLQHLFSQTGLPYRVSQAISRKDDVDENGKPRQHVTQTNNAGLVDYNPDYFQKQVLPYQYAGQLRRQIQDLTRDGQTVYSTVELDQAEKVGISPAQVRILRSILDNNGQRKTQTNIKNLYYLSQP